MEIRPGRIHTHTHIHTRVSGNEIKKIANNSNRNCPGHIPSFPLIRSLYGAEGERGGRKEERNHSTTFRIDASSRSGLSDRFSFRGLVSGCYLQPPPLLYTVLRKRPTLRKNSFGSNKQARSFLLQIGNKRSTRGTTSFEHRFCRITREIFRRERRNRDPLLGSFLRTNRAVES